MELTWIDDFLALCQTRNFTRAAEARYTTQSAYSRRIQRLEDWLGAPLFYRETRPVGLTPAGDEFLLRAARMREDIFDARRAVLSTSSHFRKTLRIYTTNTLAIAFLTRWLHSQKLEHYSVIVASIAGCMEATRRRQADIALIPQFGEDTPAGLVIEAVGQDRLILVASPSLKQPIGFAKAVLAGPILAYTPGTNYGTRIAELLKQRRVTVAEQPLCESASAEALLAQVKAGLGAAWLPEMLIEGTRLQRCPVPEFFDLPYRIVALRPLAAPVETDRA